MFTSLWYGKREKQLNKSLMKTTWNDCLTVVSNTWILGAMKLIVRMKKKLLLSDYPPTVSCTHLWQKNSQISIETVSKS